MANKKIIEDALVSAKEIEEAAIENAKDIMIEAFSPDFTNFFKDILTEEEEVVDDKDEEEFEVDEEEPVEEGTEHDIGKEPDAGRDDTDASDEVNEAEEELSPEQKKDMDVDDDNDIDADDLKKLRNVEEKLNINVSEEEEEEKEESPADEESEEDMEIPEELFDDKESEAEEELDDDGIELSDDLDEDDEELDLDIEDDGEDLEVADSDEFDAEDEDEIEEGLYIRKEGEFAKITPEEYLNIRKGELEEENEKLSAAIGALQGQLQETHLFNAKLAHVNKLFSTGQLTKDEKSKFVVKIDECESVDDVKVLYESAVNDLSDSNPLEEFSEILKEHRNKKQPEDVFQSIEMKRMKRMAGLGD